MSAKRLDRASARGRRRSPGAAGPPRDFKGYGRNPPDPHWPGGARIAVNINLNFEAGGEHCLLEGDDRSEDTLNDIGFPAYHGVRSPIVEIRVRIRPAQRRLASVAYLQASSKSRSAFSAWCAALQK